jgi:hypothetical protein
MINKNIVFIANELKLNFLDKIQDSNIISIFLCGGNNKKEVFIRKNLGEKLESIASKYSYNAYYPEDMFVEIMLGHFNQNLLTLENFLADFVDVVVILLNSPGTFTELGAFTNHNKLNNKLLIIIDPKHERAKSFINLGPIKYLKTNTKSKVIYLDINKDINTNILNIITENIRTVSKNIPKKISILNPILAYKYYLSLIFVFDPINKDDLLKIIKISKNDEDSIIIAAETIINSLIAEKKIINNSNILSITSQGRSELIYEKGSKKKNRDTLNILTPLRIKALNLILRKNNKNIFGAK